MKNGWLPILAGGSTACEQHAWDASHPAPKHTLRTHSQHPRCLRRVWNVETQGLNEPSTRNTLSTPALLLLPPVATFPRTDHWRCTTLHYIHCTPLQFVLHYILQCIRLDSITLQNCIALTIVLSCTIMVPLWIALRLRMRVVQRPCDCVPPLPPLKPDHQQQQQQNALVCEVNLMPCKTMTYVDWCHLIVYQQNWIWIQQCQSPTNAKQF